MHDLRRFARQYFRQFFEGLTSDTLLVLDNLQEALDAPDLQVVIDQMILEVPSEVSVCLISRTDLPQCFSPHLASQRVTSAVTLQPCGSEMIAVGMRIAAHPPHRSQRARLRHWALTLDG